MKLLVHILLFFPLFAFAQTSYEAWINKPGQVLQSTIKETGKIKDLTISTVYSKNEQTGEVMEAIRFTQNSTVLLTVYAYGSLTIDAAETDGLIKALEQFIEKINMGKPQEETSLMFITTNNIVFYLQHPGTAIGMWEVGIYRRNQQTQAIVTDTRIGIRQKDLNSVVSILKKAKEQLQ